MTFNTATQYHTLFSYANILSYLQIHHIIMYYITEIISDTPNANSHQDLYFSTIQQTNDMPRPLLSIHPTLWVSDWLGPEGGRAGVVLRGRGCGWLCAAAVIGSGGAAAESREQAEADEPGAGGAPEEPALARPQEPRVGGIPHQGALPHLRGEEETNTHTL